MLMFERLIGLINNLNASKYDGLFFQKKDVFLLISSKIVPLFYQNPYFISKKFIMKNILFICFILSTYQVAFAQDTKIRVPKDRVIIRQQTPVLTPPSPQSPVNDTIAMPGANKDKRLLTTFQTLVGKTNIKYTYTSTKAPNADGTHWYSTFGEGTLNWNANGTKLMGSFKRYFSDRKTTGQGFDKNSGEAMTIEIDATNQKITLNSSNTYTTELRNGLIYGFNMANEIIVVTLPIKSMQ